ncbi:MAG: zinc ribbon domain-containing protein [Anaerolineales bacterium]|jgi:putative FmdB family regulatory protein
MPFYDFQCDQCQQTFEVRATFREKEAGLHPLCPHCHSEDVHQVVSAGFVMRGSGGPLTPPSCGPNFGPGCC